MKVFGFAGYSGAGKTTLLEALIPRFVAAGLRVSLLKHAHHHFDIDRPGKDSYRLREAGCAEVLLVSGQRWALMHELRGAGEPPLAELLAHLAPVDLVLVEGYKSGPHSKVETHRGENPRPLLALENPTIRAVASNAAPVGLDVPVFDLDDTSAIADFVLGEVGL